MGDSNFSPIPDFRPSHCPQTRISNASQPTPSDYIYHKWLYIIIYSIRVGNIIDPRKRFRCITSVAGFKVAKFDSTER